MNQPLLSKLHQMMPHRLERHEVPGVAIAIVAEGRLTWQAGYGLANREQGLIMSAQTVCNVASLSKPITAWGILQLAETGVIALHEPVNSYLSKWQLTSTEYDVSAVTVGRLLSHMAGLSMPSIPGFPMETALPSLCQTLSGHYDNSIYAQPGTAVELCQDPGDGFLYSGGGFMVLQQLVEEVSGLQFGTYMKAKVLTPLGMDASQYGWDADIDKQCAVPYLASGKRERLFRFAVPPVQAFTPQPAIWAAFSSQMCSKRQIQSWEAAC